MNFTNSLSMPAIGALDHYTLIVEDAKACLAFYTKILGFKLIHEIPLNTGTVNIDNVDMINYVLELPGKEEQLCVITQGLNDRTMFSQYVKKYGSGVHHVAYRCSNIESVFDECKNKNITLASDEIVTDPLFGLKQFFIDRAHSGAFIEIIERVSSIKKATFTNENMKKLANTLQKSI